MFVVVLQSGNLLGLQIPDFWPFPMCRMVLHSHTLLSKMTCFHNPAIVPRLLGVSGCVVEPSLMK